MNKKLKITLATILAVGLLAIPLGSTALAAGPSNDSGTYANGNGTGICTATGPGYNTEVHEAVCQLLGITEDELYSLRLEGMSLAEIAASYGVGEDELVEAIMAVKRATVQAQVEAGLITQEQAEWRLQNMLEMTYRMIYSTGVGNGNGNGNGTGICTVTGTATATGIGGMQQHGKNAH